MIFNECWCDTGRKLKRWMGCPILSVWGNPKPEWLLIKMWIEFAFPPPPSSGVQSLIGNLRNGSFRPSGNTSSPVTHLTCHEILRFPCYTSNLSRAFLSCDSQKLTRSHVCVCCFFCKVYKWWQQLFFHADEDPEILPTTSWSSSEIFYISLQPWMHITESAILHENVRHIWC